MYSHLTALNAATWKSGRKFSCPQASQHVPGRALTLGRRWLREGLQPQFILVFAHFMCQEQASSTARYITHTSFICCKMNCKVWQSENGSATLLVHKSTRKLKLKKNSNSLRISKSSLALPSYRKDNSDSNISHSISIALQANCWASSSRQIFSLSSALRPVEGCQ